MATFQNVLLICLSSVLVLVSPNPLIQRLPLNSCPVHGAQQQQRYSTFELPPQLAKQLQIQLSPQPSIQLGQHPPSQQQYSIQIAQQHPCQLAQEPQPVQPKPCPVHNLSNDGNKELVSRVLSNPLIQALIKQKARQTKTNVQNKPTSPQVVNNYFIIPTEILLNGTKESESKNHARSDKEHLDSCQMAHGRQKKLKKVTEVRRVGGDVPREEKRSIFREATRPKTVRDDVMDDNSMMDERRRKVINNPENNTDVYELSESFHENCEPQIKKSDDRDDSFRPSNTNNGEHDQGSRSEMRNERLPAQNTRSEQQILVSNSKRNNVSNGLNAVNMKRDENNYINRKQMVRPSQNNQHHKPQNTKINIKEEKVETNPNDEAIINEAKQKFPGMSDKEIRELLDKVKQQMINHKHRHHSIPRYHFRPPSLYWRPSLMPYQMNPYYPDFPFNLGYRLPHKKRKNKKQKKNQDNNLSNDNSTLSPNQTNKSNSSISKEMITNSETSTKLPLLEKETKNEEKLKPFDKTTPYIGDVNKDVGSMKLGEEDEIPNMDENDIHSVNDYGSDDSFDDELYDYYEDDIRRSERGILHGNVKQYQNYILEKMDQKINDKQEISDETDDVAYKTPPALDKPDFQTTKISKEGYDLDTIKPSEDNGKYYPVFEPVTKKKKKDEIALKKIVPRDDQTLVVVRTTPSSEKENKKIETHFVNSKTVNYHTQNVTKEAYSNKNEDQNKVATENGTTIVIAESIKSYR